MTSYKVFFGLSEGITRTLKVPRGTLAYQPHSFGWILGEVVRRVSGQPLDEFLASQLPPSLAGLRLRYDGEAAETYWQGPRPFQLAGVDLSAQFERVEAHRVGERVHRPLDRVGGLGTTGAAVGVGGRERGEHRRAAEVVRDRQVVHAAVQERAEDRDARGDQLEVGAHVGEQPHAHGGELAVGVGGELDVLALGPVFGWWISILAVCLGIWALSGWVFEFYRGDYQH